jgi:hypothetical protein
MRARSRDRDGARGGVPDGAPEKGREGAQELSGAPFAVPSCPCRPAVSFRPCRPAVSAPVRYGR